jgi:hypothetical protein
VQFGQHRFREAYEKGGSRKAIGTGILARINF